MAHAIEAVLFDYGMVLSGPPNPEAWQRMRSISGLGEEVLHREYWAYRHEYDCGTYTGPDYWQKIAAGAGVHEFTAAELANLIEADTDLWTDLNHPMVAWAQTLQRAGVRTGVLSNIGDEMETGVRRKLGWLKDFHHHTFSHALKLAKPEAEIYRHAAEGMGTDAGRILFIDDRLDNIEAARQSGMEAIQYVNHPAFLHEMQQRGFGDLLELSPAPS